MLVVMDKPNQEQYPSQPLQTNNKQYKIAVTFLTGYNGIFNITTMNNEFFFTTAIHDDCFNDIIIPQGASELESLNKEIKRINIEEEHFKEVNCPFSIKPIFSTLGSNIETLATGGIQISFIHDDRMRDVLGFIPTVIHDGYNLSDSPVDNLSFDNIFFRL